MSSDSDEKSGYDDLLVQALPIGNIDNIDPSVPPSSAEEYLTRVVWEARQYNDVKTVALQKEKIKKTGPLVQKKRKMQAPREYIPSPDIQQDFLAQFSQLTAKIERCKVTKNIPKCPVNMPGETEEGKWCAFCFGRNFQRNLLTKEGKPESGNSGEGEGQAPLLSILLNLSSIALENLLEWQSHWLEVTGFSEPQGRWLFSLLACLEKPLTPETCSVLRHILQLCALIRASLDSKDHPHLIQLNMLITIIAKYFQQNDLADL